MYDRIYEHSCGCGIYVVDIVGTGGGLLWLRVESSDFQLKAGNGFSNYATISCSHRAESVALVYHLREILTSSCFGSEACNVSRKELSTRLLSLLLPSLFLALSMSRAHIVLSRFSQILQKSRCGVKISGAGKVTCWGPTNIKRRRK